MMKFILTLSYLGLAHGAARCGTIGASKKASLAQQGWQVVAACNTDPGDMTGGDMTGDMTGSDPGTCVDDPDGILAAEGNTCQSKFGDWNHDWCNSHDDDYNGYQVANLYQLCPLTCGRCPDYVRPDCVMPDKCCCEGDNPMPAGDWDATWMSCPVWAALGLTLAATGRDPTPDEWASLCAEYATEPCASDPNAQSELALPCAMAGMGMNCPVWAAQAATGTDPIPNDLANMCAEFGTEPCASDPTAQMLLAPHCGPGGAWVASMTDCPAWGAYITSICPMGPDSCSRDPNEDEMSMMCAEYATEPCASDGNAQLLVGPDCVMA